MFANFDFDVILRSLPYLFYQGMTFTLLLTALATLGGIVLGVAILVTVLGHPSGGAAELAAFQHATVVIAAVAVTALLPWGRW